ncbi:response regulator [Deinococcus aquiradiocola]|uniref:Transcriptional regulator n=1 Tax=Deinococcus aquiradiocola TaxID=393059 RepID=A0A917PBT2_9DEIO|nr:response regulator [Deinococcus aquiradiocola]GGJ69794.1 transcriptional regulator [Deinococcus aquiradiocola]
MTRILVVDDSLSIRKALEKILSQTAVVHVANSAEDALAQLHAGLEPPDLIVSDVLMPGMSGFELAHELRLLPATLRTPVLLMSGIIDDDVHHQAQEVHARGVIRKPFTAEELMPVIHAALSGAPGVSAESAPVQAPPAVPEEPELLSGPGPVHADPAPEPVPAAPVSPAPRTAATQPAASAPPPVTPAPAPVAPAPSAHQALLDTLTQKPGVLGALVLTRHGEVQAHSGDLAVAPADLAMYARFFASTAGTLGNRMERGALSGLQLEYAGGTLLLLPLDDADLLVTLLKDVNSSQMVRFALRRHLTTA